FRSLLQFDLSSVPVGVGITAADLRLYFCAAAAATAYYVRAHEVLADWTESGVTWTNQPSHNATYESQVSLGNVYGWYTWPLLTLVRAWCAGTKAKRGFKLLHSNETVTNGGKEFYSSDYTTDPTLRPKLEITYTARPTVSITSPNGTQASPTVVSNDVTPDLVGVYNSSDSVNMAYRQHQVLDELGNVVWDSGKVAQSAAAGSTITVTVPAGELVYGEKYRWRWMAWDANGGYSEWSSEGWFICSLTAPTGLVATPRADLGQIDLGWDAHPGENLAGYRVYREIGGKKELYSLGLVVSTGYSDDAPVSGATIKYTVAAVASDGYEGPECAAVEATVTLTKQWLGDLAVTALEKRFSHPRRSEALVALDGSTVWQDYGFAPRL
ncbi:MAG: DNRLRE domain-containing protein, partial [Firmicutes bacterium]|nr:DNRLRE domain-containing protein [Bacillota bacterium]